MPVVGFLPPDDPRVRGTVAAIERELMVDGLVLRYRTKADVDGSAAGRRCLSSVQLLACRQLHAAEPRRRSIAPCSSACYRFATMSTACSRKNMIPRLQRQVGNLQKRFSSRAHPDSP